MQKYIICIICILFSIAGISCISMEDLGLIDVVSVNSAISKDGQVAFSDGDVIYLTDFRGDKYLKIAEEDIDNSSVSLSKEGILYIKKPKDIWTLNLYDTSKNESVVLLQEVSKIKLPVYSDEISYMVFPEDDSVGNINIYEKDSARAYVLFENVYYDYEWLYGKRKIAAITVSNINEDIFQGSVVIKDIENLSEEIIFTGTFGMKKDYLDIRQDGDIIFSSEGEIYVYNPDTKELLTWEGPEGYDYRLPPSVNSALKGYVLAKVKGIEEGWNGQLYLVPQNGEFIRIPAWSVWIEEPFAVCIDVESLLAVNLDTNEITDLIKNVPKK